MSGQGGEKPQWWRGAVIYQVYPRSFRDSNGDGVGDLRGVIAGLDHIAGLGVDGLWLSPFYRSPMKDFGYDVSDYCEVDPQFGTLADFDELLVEAHRRGLKVIIDQVWAHTSDEHSWFQASATARDGEKADWYVWADAKPDGSPPTNWQAAFGGPSWTWVPARRQYYFHNFLVEQPDLNYWNPEVREAILSVARFWLDRGVDGFRLDVINYIVHDRDLRDNPTAEYNKSPSLPTYFQRHVFDRSRPEALDFLAALRKVMDGYPDRMTVGEIVDAAPFERQQEYTSPPDRLDTAYTFHFLNARKASVDLFARAIEGWSSASGWPSWSLGNHDVDRYASRLAGDDPRLTRTLLAALMCLRGTIFLYQGEELGLPQGQVPRDQLRDPFAIAAYDGGAFRDGARTPIPWTADGPSAGFSATGETWLPVDPAQRPMAIGQQEGREDSMLAFTRRLIALRRESEALRAGEARLAPLGGQDDVLAFERRTSAEALVCLFELTGAGRRLAIDEGARLIFAVEGASVSADAGRLVLDLPAYGAAVLRLAR